MKKLIMFPYKMGSASAKTLATDLGIKRVRANGTYKYYSNHVVINWGNSSLPAWWDRARNVQCLNHPNAVSKATNKRTALQLLSEGSVSVPKFFTNKEDLIQYTVDNFPTVYCRTILSGHSGNGIVLANSVSELVNAPLYTLRFKAQKEWRVHVFKDSVIDFAKKSRREGMEERASGLIRNYDGGWIFKRGGLELPDYIAAEAIKAVSVLGLDFGAVDIAENPERGVCVYEVNTACGIGGETTAANYIRAFSEYLSSLS